MNRAADFINFQWKGLLLMGPNRTFSATISTPRWYDPDFASVCVCRRRLIHITSILEFQVDVPDAPVEIKTFAPGKIFDCYCFWSGDGGRAGEHPGGVVFCWYSNSFTTPKISPSIVTLIPGRVWSCQLPITSMYFVFEVFISKLFAASHSRWMYK